jgi:hypothetical protein|nr:MAG TPA: hypothetical protein [Myoviridae sp. ctfuG5]DAN24706.1 MAG TPA: hypothetical protein [Caudoviricetes sp.]DAS63992.1 MAG TPA: hypothetical protein [Caudoviricetes sp.]
MFDAPPRPKSKQEAKLDNQIEVLERVYLDLSFKTDNSDQETVEACRKIIEHLYKQRRAVKEAKWR